MPGAAAQLSDLPQARLELQDKWSTGEALAATGTGLAGIGLLVLLRFRVPNGWVLGAVVLLMGAACLTGAVSQLRAMRRIESSYRSLGVDLSRERMWGPGVRRWLATPLDASKAREVVIRVLSDPAGPTRVVREGARVVVAETRDGPWSARQARIRIAQTRGAPLEIEVVVQAPLGLATWWPWSTTDDPVLLEDVVERLRGPLRAA